MKKKVYSAADESLSESNTLLNCLYELNDLDSDYDLNTICDFIDRLGAMLDHVDSLDGDDQETFFNRFMNNPQLEYLYTWIPVINNLLYY